MIHQFNQSNVIAWVVGVGVAILGSTAYGQGTGAEVRKLRLAVSMFDDIPKAVENEYSKRSFDNKLRAAASSSVVFEILPGNVFVKGAIEEDSEVATKLYGGKVAEYFLVNCAISGKPGSVMEASGLLVTFKDNEMEEIGTVIAEATNVDQLMARFWENVDRPVEAFQTTPIIEGGWQFVSGHDSAAERNFSINPRVGDQPLTASLTDLRTHNWRKRTFELNWNFAGYFEGRFWDTNDNAHSVTVRIVRGDGGGRTMIIKGGGLDMRASEQPKLYDTMRWTWESQPALVGPLLTGWTIEETDRVNDRNMQNSGKFAKQFDEMIAFPSPKSDNVRIVWKAGDRGKIIPGYGLNVDWQTLEVFLVGKKWHVYFMRKNAKNRIEPFALQVFTPVMSPLVNYSNTKPLGNSPTGMIYWGVVSLPVREQADNSAQLIKERLWYGNFYEDQKVEPGYLGKNVPW